MASPSLLTKSSIRTMIGLPCPRRRSLPLPSIIEIIWGFIGFGLTVAGALMQISLPDRLPQSIELGMWPPSMAWSFEPGYTFSLQIAAVLLCGCICGPIGGGLAQIAYLSVGLAGFAVFVGGGGIDYLNHPQMGYLLACIPAAMCVGHFAFRKNASLFYLTLCTLGGLLIVHLGGMLGLLIKIPFGSQLWEAVITYSALPLPGQILSAFMAAGCGWVVRRLLWS
jgi:biotin transport system substrate-specific component